MPRDARASVRKGARDAQRSLLEGLFEQGLPVSTAAHVPAADLGLTRADDHAYEPAGYTFVLRALYPHDIPSADAFLDYGCGRGRVVWMAARHHPFGRVYGLEIVPGLAEAARRNLAAGRDRLRCRDTRVVEGDAMQWPVPDEVTHAFHHNSVGGEVLQGMLEQLIASYDARPRRLLFHYANPIEHERVLRTGRMLPPPATKGLRRDLPYQRIVTYALQARA